MNDLLAHCKLGSAHAPLQIVPGEVVEGAEPATYPIFEHYLNKALASAMRERLQQWGTSYYDPNAEIETDAGVKVFKVYQPSLKLERDGNAEKVTLYLNCVMKSRVIRNVPLLEQFHRLKNQDKRNFEQFIGQQVVTVYDKKIYVVHRLDFENSANTLMVKGLNMSHTDYFKTKKHISLQSPDARPMIVCRGRHKQDIYFPPELVCSAELDNRVRQQLPKLCSFTPTAYSEGCDDTVKRFLIPGEQKSKGFEIFLFSYLLLRLS